MLEVVNSVPEQADGPGSTGLGNQLIEAFTTQLDGEFSTAVEGNRFRLTLRFPIQQADTAAEARTVVLTSAARRGARH